MKNPNTPPLNLKQFKGKTFTLQIIRNEVEKRTGKSLNELITEYSALKRYEITLSIVTTTNKAVCQAMLIPVEAGTKYKRRLEKSGLLISSIDEFRCPYTGDLAHILSTNPSEFDKLRKVKNPQLTLF